MPSSHLILCSTVQQLAHRGWHQKEGEEMGDGRAEGLSAIGDGGKATVSLAPDVDGTGSGSLLDSVLSSRLKKMIQ